MDNARDGVTIGTYEYLNYDDPAAVFRPYDPRSPEVARRVAELVEARMPDGRMDGSSTSAARRFPIAPGRATPICCCSTHRDGWSPRETHSTDSASNGRLERSRSPKSGHCGLAQSIVTEPPSGCMCTSSPTAIRRRRSCCASVTGCGRTRPWWRNTSPASRLRWRPARPTTSLTTVPRSRSSVA